MSEELKEHKEFHEEIARQIDFYERRLSFPPTAESANRLIEALGGDKKVDVGSPVESGLHYIILLSIKKMINSVISINKPDKDNERDELMLSESIRDGFEEMADIQGYDLTLDDGPIKTSNPYKDECTRRAYKIWCCAINFEKSLNRQSNAR